MKLNNAKKIIKEIYKTESVTALISERGVGKTSIFKQCTDEMNIGYIDIYAAALEGPDFMGLPNKDLDNGITSYLPPKFLPTIQTVEKGIHKKEGLLILEEINRVSPDTISVLYPLLLDRKLNGHILADGWKIGVTMNPDNMNYMVNTLDDAIIDRFVSIYIEPSIEDYYNYSLNNHPNKSVLDFLSAYPEMLLIVKPNGTPMQKSPTPRGWSKVQEILNKCIIDDDILQETLTGIVGAEAAASFIGYKNLQKNSIVKAEDLLNDFSLVEGKIIQIINENRFDIITNLIKSIASKIDKSKINEIKELNIFLNVLPQELQVLFYKELSNKDDEILDDISEYLDSFDNVSEKIIDLMIS